MKVKLTETDIRFYIEFEPETIEEAARLIRLGMNHAQALPHVTASAHSDGTISADVTLDKVKRGSAQVARGKW